MGQGGEGEAAHGCKSSLGLMLTYHLFGLLVEQFDRGGKSIERRRMGEKVEG